LTSAGTGASACGSFTFTLNVALIDAQAITLTATQPTCATNNDPPAITSTAVTGTVTYQWQQSTTSCITGFVDISGATSSSYDPPVLTQATNYRLIATYENATCPNDNCLVTSDCVTLIPEANCCPDPNCFNLSVSRN